MSKGQLFVVSAPSGAGKTTLVTAALGRVEALQRTISHTTRAPRGAEVDGVDYHFISMETFRAGLAADRFAEYAEVFGRFYGTAVDEVETKLEAGIDAVAVIDWQGARSMRERYPDAVTVFVVPPSREVLRQRLIDRGEDSVDEIERRLAEALLEAAHFKEFDYVLLNDELEEAVAGFIAIVRSARQQTRRQQGVGLLGDLSPE